MGSADCFAQSGEVQPLAAAQVAKLRYAAMAEPDDLDSVLGRSACQSTLAQTIEQREGWLESSVIVIVIVIVGPAGAGRRRGPQEGLLGGDHEQVADRHIFFLGARRSAQRRRGGNRGRALRGCRDRQGGSRRMRKGRRPGDRACGCRGHRSQNR
jgi:hypothetical protein